MKFMALVVLAFLYLQNLFFQSDISSRLLVPKSEFFMGLQAEVQTRFASKENKICKRKLYNKCESLHNENESFFLIARQFLKYLEIFLIFSYKFQDSFVNERKNVDSYLIFIFHGILFHTQELLTVYNFVVKNINNNPQKFLIIFHVITATFFSDFTNIFFNIIVTFSQNFQQNFLKSFYLFSKRNCRNLPNSSLHNFHHYRGGISQ